MYEIKWLPIGYIEQTLLDGDILPHITAFKKWEIKIHWTCMGLILHVYKDGLLEHTHFGLVAQSERILNETQQLIIIAQNRSPRL